MSRAPESSASRAVASRSARSRLWVILAVCGGVAVGLRALDQLPPWWLDEPRTPLRYTSVQEFERLQRTRLLLPYVFPDSLVWPPTRVTLSPGAGRPVLIEFARADGSGIGLALSQALDGDVALPERIVPLVALTPVPAASREDDTPITRGTDRDGRQFLQVSRVFEGRRVVLRWYDADPAPLRRMARSLRRG
jgi:hypothetical protein